MDFNYFTECNKDKDNINYISYLIFLEEMKKINEYCSNKCIITFQKDFLDESETKCIQSCTEKLVDLSSYALGHIRNYNL